MLWCNPFLFALTQKPLENDKCLPVCRPTDLGGGLGIWHGRAQFWACRNLAIEQTLLHKPILVPKTNGRFGPAADRAVVFSPVSDDDMRNLSDFFFYIYLVSRLHVSCRITVWVWGAEETVPTCGGTSGGWMDQRGGWGIATHNALHAGEFTGRPGMAVCFGLASDELDHLEGQTNRTAHISGGARAIIALLR